MWGFGFFFFLQVRSTQEFILLMKTKMCLIGIYKEIILMQSFLCNFSHQHLLWCWIFYSVGFLLIHTENEILHGIDLYLDKDFIYINRKDGKQETFPFFSRVFSSTPLVNVLFTILPVFFSFFFSSDGAKSLESGGTYF